MSTPPVIRFPNACPRCRRGRIYARMLSMNEACPHCGLRFIQESGQHLGAAAVAYGMGALVAIPLFFILLSRRVSPLAAVGIPTLVLAALAPFNVRFSRQLWTHVMYQLNH